MYDHNLEVISSYQIQLGIKVKKLIFKNNKLIYLEITIPIRIKF